MKARECKQIADLVVETCANGNFICFIEVWQNDFGLKDGY